MTEAINTPVRRARRETSTADTPIQQMQPSEDGEGGLDPFELEPADEAALKQEYLEALKFMDEPVKIIISQGTERGAPLTVDCWVNGRGAEIWLNGKWAVSGWLPVNMEIITKRKYLENLLRSKPTSYQTVVGKPGDEVIRNASVPTTTLRNQISLLEDKNPLGRAWFQSVVQAPV